MALDDNNHEEVIEQWMLTIIRDDGIRHLDDLHIDQIAPGWKAREAWIEGGLEAFRLAMEIRDGSRLPFVVGLGFSLESGDQPRGVDFQGREDLRDSLNCSPPSLYLFHRGGEPDAQSICGTVQHLDPAILGADGDVRCYYLEFKQDGSDEYFRSVFVDG
jgi:hypothetical protein